MSDDGRGAPAADGRRAPDARDAGAPGDGGRGAPPDFHIADPGAERVIGRAPPGAPTRRAFVAGAVVLGAGMVAMAVGAPALVGIGRKGGRALAGALLDDGSASGHAVRDGRGAVAVRRVERVPVVIVGGGMAGLSAAWWLRRRGMTDFALVELAREPGGNSRWGENDVSAYPLGAHYVPVPGPRAEHVRLLFEEMGVLADGAWRERDLCFTPKERTYVHGRWRDGLEEAVAAGPEDRAELARFAERVAELRATGEMTIPLALGAGDGPGSTAGLDALTAEAWLAREGFRARAVRWLVDYACRDDFGTAARDASAWAALHYFVARDGDAEGPLTWPEGNGRIARHLMAVAAPHVTTAAPVHRVARHGGGMRVTAGDRAWDCDAVIWAAPSFVGARVVDGAPAVPWRYAPWLVVNLTLDRRPRAAPDDAPASWDNVLADSRGLGYVDATHQQLRAMPDERAVWTWYWATCDEDPAAARRRLLAMDWRACAEAALTDLERAHPDVRSCVTRADVMRYGHAMPRPEPGFLAARRAWWEPDADARVLWANSDVSGLSLFEEAQDRGIRAAERALALLARG